MSYRTPATHDIAANTSRTGLGAGAEVVYQAQQPCYVDRLVFQSLGTNAATVARVFVSGLNPQEGNYLNREVTLAITAASEVAGLAATELTLDIALAAGQRIIVTVGTAPTAGWDVSAVVLSPESLWTYKSK